MISIDGIYDDLLVINKSKFYSYVYPITSEADAKKYIDELWKKHSDATHICTAYLISSPKIEKANDDGEPSGTAGKPMLELLKKRGLDNVLLAVVRYFGGIKLGAGGLVRAYTNAGNVVLDKTKVVEIRNVDEFQIVVDIALGNKVNETIRSGGGEILSCRYSNKVEINFLNYDIEKLKRIYSNCEVKKVGSRFLCQK